MIVAIALCALLQEAPVPAEAEQKRAEAVIRDLYRADYAKKDRASRRALAVKLLGLGQTTKDDAAARYVLLREARDIAAETADVATLMAAADALGAESRTAALVVARKAAATPDEVAAVAEALLEVCHEHLHATRYDEAIKAAREAESAAKTAKDATLAARAAEVLKEIPELKREQEQTVRAELTLSVDPNDPQANQIMGRFTCFQLGEWERGLPFLAKAVDPGLREAAAKELSKPVTPAEAGEAWRALADKAMGTDRRRYQTRALHWFEKALPGLTGLAKLKVEGYIDAAHKTAEGKDAVRRGLVFWVEPGRDPSDPFRELISGAKATNHGAKIDPATRAISFAQTWIDYAASDAVKQIEKQGSMFAWIKADAYPSGGVVNRGDGARDDFSLWVFRGNGGVFMNWPENGYPASLYLTKSPLPLSRWTHLGAVWNEKSVWLFLDGKLDAELPLKTGAPIRRSGVVSVGSNPPGGHEYYTGLVGSVMIYARALPSAEAAQLHAVGRGRFR